MLADQALDLYHYLHFKLYLVRAIAPELLSFGSGESCSTLYINNLAGLSKAIRDPDEHAYARWSTFCPLEVLQSETHSFKTDLLGLGLLLVYFYKGELPWYRPSEDTFQRPDSLLKKMDGKADFRRLTEGMPK
jgi:hypothetical protein